jgi:hypothetical protein
VYQLPEPPDFPADVYAADRVALSSQFRRDVIERYKANYENFWAIGREEVGKEEMQAILDRLGPTALEILLDAYLYVQGIIVAFPDDLPERYHEAPYTYTVDSDDRIILGELKAAWLPNEDEAAE